MNLPHNPNIIILTGPVHSGKSGFLEKWIRGKSVSGFITPVMEEKKILIDITSGSQGPYQVSAAESESVTVGKYHINKNAFIQAAAIEKKAMLNPAAWFVLDEIGKLELNNEGHHAMLLHLLSHWPNNLLLVVREELLQEVIAKYRLESAAVTQKNTLH